MLSYALGAIIEAALNHVTIHSPIASIYNRARYRPEVAKALQALANKLDHIAGQGQDNVIELPAKEFAG